MSKLNLYCLFVVVTLFFGCSKSNKPQILTRSQMIDILVDVELCRELCEQPEINQQKVQLFEKDLDLICEHHNTTTEVFKNSVVFYSTKRPNTIWYIYDLVLDTVTQFKKAG